MVEKEVFEYTYSAPIQDEVRRIREKYLPRETTRLDQLRVLDQRATKRGNAISIAHGTVCALLLGLGMSCCLVWSGKWFVSGVLIGSIGLAGAAVTHPLYNHVVKREREKIAPEILRLTEECM